MVKLLLTYFNIEKPLRRPSSISERVNELRTGTRPFIKIMTRRPRPDNDRPKKRVRSSFHLHVDGTNCPRPTLSTSSCNNEPARN